MVDSLTQAMQEGVEKLRLWPGKTVRIFHHNDSDGLTSGAILLTALKREGYSVDRYALEKPYPLLLEKIFERTGEVLIFADFAGKIAPLLSKLNKDRNLVIILDHHSAEQSASDLVLNLDGDLHGLKGDVDISGSATCHLFALQLNRRNEDLSVLGVLGAIGDGFFVNGALHGVNRDILKEAEKSGYLKTNRNGEKEEYSVILGGREYTAEFICGALDTLGAVGYYQGGSAAGISFCLDGLTEDIKNTVSKYEEIKRAFFDREIELLRKGGLHTGKHLQWFNLENRFTPMGVKMVGLFCEKIMDMDFLDPSKYLAGFQVVPNEIPGFGQIQFDSTKISMRASTRLAFEIQKGLMPPISGFLPEATGRIGGFSDACHSLSGATTIETGQEEVLIQGMESLLDEKNNL